MTKKKKEEEKLTPSKIFHNSQSINFDEPIEDTKTNSKNKSKNIKEIKALRIIHECKNANEIRNEIIE